MQFRFRVYHVTFPDAVKKVQVKYDHHTFGKVVEDIDEAVEYIVEEVARLKGYGYVAGITFKPIGDIEFSSIDRLRRCEALSELEQLKVWDRLVDLFPPEITDPH